MKQYLFIFVSYYIFFPFSLFGQQKASICAYYGDNSRYSPKDICDYVSFISNAEAEKTIDNILKQVGLERNFIVMECKNIENCMAINLPGEIGTLRYIIYDNAFLNRVQSKTGTDWSAISILAHEIGHHLQGHTLDGLGSRPLKELQADKFSGFILRKLGASLKNAQAAIRELQSEQGSSTHPPKIERLDAIAKGWQDAISIEQNFPTVEKRIVKTQPATIDQATYNKYMQKGAELYHDKRIQEALGYFQYASDHNPADTTSSLYTGISAQEIKNNEIASKYFNRFIDFGGKDPQIFYSLAMIYKDNNDFSTAFKILERGIIVNPNDKDLIKEAINLNIVSGNTFEAINNLKKLVDEDPSDLQNLLNLGLLYDSKGKKTEAIGIYTRLLALQPNNYDANFNMAVLQYNQAVEMNAELNKMDMKTYLEKGKPLEEKACDKFFEAKPYFDRCKYLKPSEQVVDDSLIVLQKILKRCGK